MGALVVGLARRAALATDAESLILTCIFGAELFGTGIGDALERAAVLVVGAVGILRTARKTAVVCAGATCARNALLGLGTGPVETGQQTLAIDAYAGVTTLEVELATKGRWIGIVLQRV
jgi:hypothetical protein